MVATNWTRGCRRRKLAIAGQAKTSNSEQGKCDPEKAAGSRLDKG